MHCCFLQMMWSVGCMLRPAAATGAVSIWVWGGWHEDQHLRAWGHGSPPKKGGLPCQGGGRVTATSGGVWKREHKCIMEAGEKRISDGDQVIIWFIMTSSRNELLRQRVWAQPQRRGEELGHSGGHCSSTSEGTTWGGSDTYLGLLAQPQR